MIAKIRIGENDTRWPAQFQGKEVSVEVLTVRFPDGVLWSCEGYFAEILPDAEGAKGTPEPIPSPKQSLIEAIGAQPRKLEIEF